MPHVFLEVSALWLLRASSPVWTPQFSVYRKLFFLLRKFSLPSPVEFHPVHAQIGVHQRLKRICRQFWNFLHSSLLLDTLPHKLQPHGPLPPQCAWSGWRFHQAVCGLSSLHVPGGNDPQAEGPLGCWLTLFVPLHAANVVLHCLLASFWNSCYVDFVQFSSSHWQVRKSCFCFSWLEAGGTFPF